MAEAAGLPRRQVRRIATAAAGQRAPALDDAPQRCVRELPAR